MRVTELDDANELGLRVGLKLMELIEEISESAWVLDAHPRGGEGLLMWSVRTSRLARFVEVVRRATVLVWAISGVAWLVDATTVVGAEDLVIVDFVEAV